MARRRLTPMQREFARHMARTGDREYAAAKAGYASPRVAGWKLLENPEVELATRELQQHFALDKAGAISIVTLVEVATGKAFPAGARVSAAKELRQMSGIGVDEAPSGKDLSDMSPEELRRFIDAGERRVETMKRALADQARPVLEHDRSTIDEEQEDNPNPGVFD